MSTDARAGAISRTDLDQTLREITHLVEQAREPGGDSDAIGEHRALRTARAKLADLDAQLADRVDELTAQHAHRPGFDTDD